MRLEDKRQVIIATLEPCVRCGGTHQNLEFSYMEQPMDCGGVLFTHWGVCPTNKAPILLRVNTEAA